MSRTSWLTLALSLIALPCAAQTVPLEITVGGSAQGTAAVIGPGGGLCETPSSSTCTFQIPTGSSITVAVNAPGGQQPGRLSAGTGAAAGCALSRCTFTMTGAASLTAIFTIGDGPVATLTTTMAGDGSGSVGADNSRCQNFDAAQPSACVTLYLQGSAAGLAAAPAAGSRFSGYSGTAGAAACGAAAQCSFTLGADATVTATFHKLVAVRVQPLSLTRLIGETATFTASGQYSNGVTETLAPGPGTWKLESPALNSFRYSFAAVRNAVGSTGVVYALGGIVGNGPSALVEANSGTGWVTKAPMTTPREGLGAAILSGQVYAIGGGNTIGGGPVSTVERYNAASDSWVPVAPLTAGRRYLAAQTVGQAIYAVGGETTVSGSTTVTGKVEAYDTDVSAWLPRTSMPTPRRLLGLASANGILYAIGGQAADSSFVATVEAYDPATDTWTTKAPMPAPRGGMAVVSSGMLLYVFGGLGPSLTAQPSTYVYDAATDTWTTKTDMSTSRAYPAGVVSPAGSAFWAIGGFSATGTVLGSVEGFQDSLAWFSGRPQTATVSQSGIATARGFGTATISAAAGGIACTIFPVNSCGLIDVHTLPTDLSLDVPSNNATVSRPFTIAGWAINRSASTGTGVSGIHVYAVPSGGNAIFLGVAQYGGARPDIGATYGSQFTNSGFNLTASGLAAGVYTINVYALNAMSGAFDAVKTATVTVTVPVSNGFIAVDYPAAGSVVTSAFEVTGWAIDQGAGIGTGVDGVQFYIQVAGAPAPGVFVGTGSYGSVRNDVGGIFGARFTNSGYHFTITGLGPLTGNLNVYAHSTVTGAYSIVKVVPITVNSNQLMSIDAPAPESTVTGPTFQVAGWAIDRATATGTGVDALHIYAFPNPGSGQAAIFLGVATIGIARSDVAGIYGARYTNSGYSLTVSTAAAGLTPGVYNIVVVAHSTSGSFNNQAAVRVTVQ